MVNMAGPMNVGSGKVMFMPMFLPDKMMLTLLTLPIKLLFTPLSLSLQITVELLFVFRNKRF
jgi:hypothetical protein